MTLYRFIVAILVMCFWIQSTHAADTTSAPIVEHSVSFDIMDGLILLKVVINGHEGSYILDSGAPGLVLNENVKNGEVLFSTLDQDIWASPEHVSLLELGPMKCTDIKAWKMDLSFLEQQYYRKIDGLLGSDFLEQHDILIDYQAQKLVFLHLENHAYQSLSMTHNIIKIPFVIGHDNLPIVELEVDGQTHHMAFDTGANINVLQDQTEEEHFDIRFNHLTVKNMSFTHRDISALQDPESVPMTGIISPYTLEADMVVISYTKQRIYLFYDKMTIASN